MSDATLQEPDGGPENHGSMLLAIIWAEASVAAIVLLARFYARAFCKKSLGWDDFWMAYTWANAVGANIVDTFGIHYGIGQHLYYLTPYNRMMAVKYDWISHAFAITATGLGKVAFACTLLRIVALKWQKYFLHGYIWLLVIINVPLIFMTYLQCDPVRALWDVRVAHHCWDPRIQAGYAVFQGIYGVLADFVLALFPLLIITKLQITRNAKLGLAGLMCVGVFATVCAIMKTTYLPRMTARADFTWETQNMIIWFTTEMYAICIASSVPCLPPIFRKKQNRVILQKAGHNGTRQTFGSSGKKKRFMNADIPFSTIVDHHQSPLGSKWGTTISTASRARSNSNGEALINIGGDGILQKTDITVTHTDVETGDYSGTDVSSQANSFRSGDS